MVKIPAATRDDILAAIESFDAEERNTSEWLGWENKRNHIYCIAFDGKQYPVKHVVSQAAGVPVSTFSGGNGSGQANRFATDRGFAIENLRQRNPNWSRDELILTLDLYLSHRDSLPSKKSTLVAECSEALNKLAPHIHKTRGEAFRNVTGVYMKLMNFRAIDPRFPASKGLSHGGILEQAVWDEYSQNPGTCHIAAAAIREAIKGYDSGSIDIQNDENDEDEDAQEGRILTRIHKGRERDTKIVKKKKASVLKKLGKLECEACGFNFQDKYGERGEGYIECHHTLPVSQINPGQRTKLAELALLCANCHRMVHSKRPWLSLDDLRKILAE